MSPIVLLLYATWFFLQLNSLSPTDIPQVRLDSQLEGDGREVQREIVLTPLV